MSKYKYYFRKPKSEIVKDVLKALLVAGALVIVAGAAPPISAFWGSRRRWQKYPKTKFYSAFYKLMKRGCLNIEKQGYDLKISLTPAGRKLAGWMQVDALRVRKPKRWDRQWRVVIFDIVELNRRGRDAFRGKLKELGFKCIQKSVWVHPYDCRDEIELLKSFFGLKPAQVLLFTTDRISHEVGLKAHFKLA